MKEMKWLQRMYEKIFYIIEFCYGQWSKQYEMCQKCFNELVYFTQTRHGHCNYDSGIAQTWGGIGAIANFGTFCMGIGFSPYLTFVT